MEVRILHQTKLSHSPNPNLRIGLDPGIRGGIAVISSSYPIQCLLAVSWSPLPHTRISPRNVTDELLNNLSPILSPYLPCPVVIEDAHAWVEQSASSSHKLALARATLQTYFKLNNCPISFVLPRIWKKRLALPGENKRPSLQFAHCVLPRRWLIKDNDAAEAILIAWSPDFPTARPSFLS